ncbi:hypothetical protein [Acidiphilium acidophilum]|uniref:hypothetical protein n=1 Tax=Acidiphilium acidophilum TaxID=76588 RepID=UPI002E8E6D56|nr:hypothetical protein [Acidiphilium acidophilum]
MMDLPCSASAEPGRRDSGRSALPLTRSQQGVLALDIDANTATGIGLDSECPSIALTPKIERLLGGGRTRK